MHAPWLDALKVAIIAEEHDDIIALTQEIPHLSLPDAIEAQAMIQESITLFQAQKLSIQETMQKIKKNTAFLAQEKQKPQLSTLS